MLGVGNVVSFQLAFSGKIQAKPSSEQAQLMVKLDEQH